MNTNQINKVVFLSNFFSHHQKPFSDEMFKLFGSGYSFIETGAMGEARKELGWKRDLSSYVVVKEEWEKNRDFYQKIIDEADVVIIGSAPEYLVKSRKKQKKVIFRYSERPLKTKDFFLKCILRYFKWQMLNFPRKRTYMLCSSAYTAFDYSRYGLFKGRSYKWAYFPDFKQYEDVDSLIAQKERASIVWVARFIDWKHPEMAIKLARKLRDDGYEFKIHMIGIGPLFDFYKNEIQKYELSQYVELQGAMSPEEVRSCMEKAEIHIFTSDRQEGWGAVLNESMNSACAVVANHAIGSVPFLLKDGENGFIYEDGVYEDFYAKVKFLLDNKDLRYKFSKNAYNTISQEWNAEVAANRFVELAEQVLQGEKAPMIFKEGVCSISEIYRDDWYKSNLDRLDK